MWDFDFSAPAELFLNRNARGSRCLGYHRFDTAAEAIRFAIEQMPQQLLVGAVLQVEDDRIDAWKMRKLYKSADYPLARANVAS